MIVSTKCYFLNQISFRNSKRTAYSDLNPLDGGQSLYPMSTVLWMRSLEPKPNARSATFKVGRGLKNFQHIFLQNLHNCFHQCRCGCLVSFESSDSIMVLPGVAWTRQKKAAKGGLLVDGWCCRLKWEWTTNSQSDFFHIYYLLSHCKWKPSQQIL